jgi:hypothetical protein
MKKIMKENTIRMRHNSVIDKLEINKFSFKIQSQYPNQASGCLDSVLKTTTATTPSYSKNNRNDSISSSFLVYNKINNLRDSNKDPFLNYEFSD